MKWSDVYGNAPKPKPAVQLQLADQAKPEPPPFDYEVGKGLCRRGPDIWLNHVYGAGWKCKRCGFIPEHFRK